jgi:hypothetical protein
VEDTDNTVCEALHRLKPDYFANGGDRKTNNTPEMEVCNACGIELLWKMGGGKIQSSSELVSVSGLVTPTVMHVDGLEIKPSKIQILTADDVAKNSDY